MNTPPERVQAPARALLSLSAWLRRQGWLRAIYQHAPVSWRERVSVVLARRAGRSLRFQRTQRWLLPGVPSELEACAATKRAAPADATRGVNVFAYVSGQFGLAEGARLYIRALLHASFPTAVCDVALDLAHSMGDRSLSALVGTSAPFDINLVFLNPDYLGKAMADGAVELAGRYTIGCWFWELEKFPEEWLPALEYVDEILVASEFVRSTLVQVTDKPVTHIPLPVYEARDSGLERSDFGLDPGAFVFLTSFDFNSFLARKNPLAAIRAFKDAFPAGREPVQLLVKTSNGHRHPERLVELLNAAAGDDRILVRDDVIDRRHIAALQRCADAYVSLHRSEGFGLGMAECMRMAKPVIATAWSGNLDFMNSSNCCPVDYRLIPVCEGEYLHTENQRWAEPDTRLASEYMRRLVADVPYRERIGRQAARDVRERLSPEAVGVALANRLDTIQAIKRWSGSARVSSQTNASRGST